MVTPLQYGRPDWRIPVVIEGGRDGGKVLFDELSLQRQGRRSHDHGSGGLGMKDRRDEVGQ